MDRISARCTKAFVSVLGLAVLASCSDQPTQPKAAPQLATRLGVSSNVSPEMAARIGNMNPKYLSGSLYAYFFGHNLTSRTGSIFSGGGPIIPERVKVFANVLVNDRSQTGLGQSETAIAISGANVVAGWNDADGFTNFLNGLSGWGLSTDNGSTFTDGVGLPRMPTANFQHSGDPTVRADGAGTFYYTDLCFDGSISGVCLTKGAVSGGTVAWGIPIYMNSSNTDLLDKTVIAVSSSGLDVYATYTRFINFGGNGQIELVASHNGGATFGAPVVLAAAGGTVQQGSEPGIGPGGEVYVVYESGWLQTTSPTIKLRKSTDGGATFSAAITVATIGSLAFSPPSGYNRTNIDDFPRIDVAKSGTGSGNVYVAVHSVVSGNCDAYMTRSTNGGTSFGALVKINNDVGTALQWWPTVAVDANGNVVTHFYDRRLNPGTALTDVFWSISTDGGLTWTPNSRVTGVSTNWQTTNTDIIPNFGDYNSIAVKSSGTSSLSYAVWGDGRNGDPDVFFAKIGNR